MSHLAVNAVLEAATLGEMEGAALLEDQHGCAAAFRCVRPARQVAQQAVWAAACVACERLVLRSSRQRGTRSSPPRAAPSPPPLRRVLKNLAQSWMEDATKRSNM